MHTAGIRGSSSYRALAAHVDRQPGPVSLANRFAGDGPTDLVDLLTGTIDLAYHPNLMGGGRGSGRSADA